jgi:hypothetical protein
VAAAPVTAGDHTTIVAALAAVLGAGRAFHNSGGLTGDSPAGHLWLRHVASLKQPFDHYGATRGIRANACHHLAAVSQADVQA